MGNKILLVGGSRDGEWVNDPDTPYLRVPVPKHIVPTLKDDDFKYSINSAYSIQIYKRKEWHFREGQELAIYVLEGTEDYDLFDLLLRNYNPKPIKTVEPPKPKPKDPEVTKRKQEDAAAAWAWNNFMGRRLE